MTPAQETKVDINDFFKALPQFVVSGHDAVGGYEYTWNAILAVRVESITSDNSGVGIGACNAKRWTHQAIKEWHPWPKLHGHRLIACNCSIDEEERRYASTKAVECEQCYTRKIGHVNCKHCGGKRLFHPCRACGQSIIHTAVKLAQVSHLVIDARCDIRIRELPSVEYAIARDTVWLRDRGDVIFFRFDGGEGVLSPCGKRTKEETAQLKAKQNN